MDNDSRVSIAAMIGSLRRESFNRKVFEAMVERTPEGVDLFELAIDRLPFYNEDLDNDDPPNQVTAFRETLSRADGVILITPEYNHSIPAVIKNAIDWGSRPFPKPPLSGKPGAMIGASFGRSGTMRAQLALRQILPVSNVLLMNKPDVYVTFAGEKFDEEGRLVDQVTLEQLDGFLAGFVEWIELVSQKAPAAV